MSVKGSFDEVLAQQKISGINWEGTIIAHEPSLFTISPSQIFATYDCLDELLEAEKNLCLMFPSRNLLLRTVMNRIGRGLATDVVLNIYKQAAADEAILRAMDTAGHFRKCVSQIIQLATQKDVAGKITQVPYMVRFDALRDAAVMDVSVQWDKSTRCDDFVISRECLQRVRIPDMIRQCREVVRTNLDSMNSCHTDNLDYDVASCRFQTIKAFRRTRLEKSYEHC